METIGIIGLGLIGGSVAKTLRTRLKDDIIIKGGDKNLSFINQALEDGVIDQQLDGDLNNIGDCDFVFLCCAAESFKEYFAKFPGRLKPGCIVTDTASVKKPVMQIAQQYPQIDFIGGHPMAGSEKSGYNASTEIMFENAFYILVKTSRTSDKSFEKLTGLVRTMSAIPIAVSAAEHDRITAAVSHVPHIAAAALTGIVSNEKDNDMMRELAASGFKDTTRIASGDPPLWQGICFANRDEIVGALDKLTAEIQKYKSYLVNGEVAEFTAALRLAKNFRDELPKSGRGKFAASYDLTVDIVDKPGTIALVTSCLGLNGVNIKNLEILNSREHDKTLRVSFSTLDEKSKGAEVLKNMGYDVDER